MHIMRFLPACMVALSLGPQPWGYTVTQTTVQSAVVIPAKAHSAPTRALALRRIAQRVGVSANALAAILAIERGRVGQVVQDSNGTADLGPAQINTVNLAYLAKRGVNIERVTTSWRTNVLAEAILLKRAVRAVGSLWGGVERYHSATKRLGEPYAVRVWALIHQPLTRTIAQS